MIDAPPPLCWFCGRTAAVHAYGLCAACHQASRQMHCLNCDTLAANRGRGLCGRCYQRLARTGQLPPPNLSTPEEVLGGI